MRKVAFYIENEEQLKDPVLCYSVMMKWMQEAGEDLIDYNCYWIDGEQMLDWMLEKGYVTQEQYDQVIENEETHIQDLILGYETGVLNGECEFPSNYKAYQVIAEYISENEQLRKDMIYLYCTSFDSAKGDETRVGMGGSYDDENGKPICSAILEDDLKTNTVSMEEWLVKAWNCDISFADEYNYLKEMTFNECDERNK